MDRRRTLLAAGGGAVLAVAPAAPRAQGGWPARPVEIVVPYAAGGPTDRYARAFAGPLSAIWGQSVVVNAKPGGAAAIGAAAVANAAPDGHTLLLGSFGIVSNPLLLRNLPYDPKALAPLSCLSMNAGILFVHPSVPATNARELQAFGKANPGVLKFGSSGIGSTPHISAELFASRAGIEIVHIPYRGTAPAMTDLLAGHINAMVDSPTSIRYAREGRIRAIGVNDVQRNRLAPEVPTMRESGFDVVCRTFYGFFAPSGVPAELQRKIAADIRRVGQAEDIRTMFIEQGLEPIGNTPEEFRRFLDEESRFWAEIFRERNIRL